MTCIYEITDLSHLASFFVWTLAVCAIAKALFGSLPAAEIQYRLSLRDALRRQRMTRLNWEISNRAKWDEDVAARSPHAARQPLSDAEIESRRAELQRFSRNSLAWRAVTYFMGCFACQAFWTAAVTFAITRGTAEFGEWVFSAAAYSGAAALLLVTVGPVTAAPVSERPAKAGCKSCGR